MPEAMNIADPKSEIRHIRFSKETLRQIGEFSRMWGNTSHGTTIALAFKLLKHLSESGTLKPNVAPLLLTRGPAGAEPPDSTD